ncbi:MAG: alpha/beta fold hydrolase [Saprospiraceae bacterium]|nr:alpha/beta fold hydrolase [Saprospiraceae bacterium]
MKNIFSTLLLLVYLLIGNFTEPLRSQEDLTQKRYLERLLQVSPDDLTVPSGDQLPRTSPAHISPEDFLWRDWLTRSGELPPDFDELPSFPFLPDPLIIDQGGTNIPVETMAQWEMKREEMKKLAQYWITGTPPPAPDNLTAELIDEKKIGPLTERNLLLRFGPGQKAVLHITLLIPPGDGPFPVFICPWKKDRYDWVQAAVRRGYIGCRFTATDPKYGYPDDSEAYEAIWWPDYDFSALMRWGWAASRTIDYLYSLREVNQEQIALTGLSRNGKSALWAAAYDDRIKAVVPISGGTGGENPFRYTTDKYNSETMPLLTWARPHWLHPRLPLFTGWESKLPVDQNSLMALIAPRGLMLTSSVTESAGNPWGIEQAYLSARKAYAFLGAEDKIAIDLRQGLHAPSMRDMERYLHFFDYVFDRGDIKPDNDLFYDYSFSKWLDLSSEVIDPLTFPLGGLDDLLLDPQSEVIQDSSTWIKKIPEIRQRINWGLGEEPPSVGPGPQSDYLREVVGMPEIGPGIETQPLSFGYLYYPTENPVAAKGGKLPAVIYLHEYAYSTGISKTGDIISGLVEAGFAVYVFDQIGFGTRLFEESRLFYDRFPKWSKMGRMVADVRWSVDVLAEHELIDANKIYVAGYSLGGHVGLYSAALDSRIAGLVSVCGFTPMRSNTPGKTGEGIYEYSHLHGLLPRLGFFLQNEDRIPYDVHEMLAAVAPRPMLVIAPTWDQYASFPDIRQSVDEVKKVYQLYGKQDRLRLWAPEDYNRCSDEMKGQVITWLLDQLK